MKILLFILFSAFFLFRPQTVEAFTVTPSFMDLSLERGERLEKSITVLNQASEAARFGLEIADVKFGTDGIPQFIFGEEISPDSVRWWINFEENVFELEPGAQKELKLSLAVPQDAGPGGHYGAVVFSRLNGEEQKDKTAVGVNQKLASLLFLNVEGQVLKLFEIEKFDPNSTLNNSLPVKFTVLIANKGNTHLQPHGMISIYDTWRNKQVGQVPVNEEFLYLFPQGNKLFEATWSDPNPLGSIWRYFGRYRAVLDMRTEGGSAVSSESFFWVLPGNIVMVVVVILVIFVSALVIYTRIIISRHRKHGYRHSGRGGYG